MFLGYNLALYDYAYILPLRFPPMLKRLIPQVLLLLIYELLVIFGLIAVVRWLTMQQTPPILRGLVFLAAMGLFIPPLMLVTTRPYRTPTWMKTVMAQGCYAPAEVLQNEHIGDYWRPQDMPRYVRLHVLVRPEAGEAFQSRLTCRLDQAQRLDVGKRLRVRYDPLKPENVAIDG